jgi:choline-glycine betaine transporter
MTIWLSAGLIFTFAAIAFTLFCCGNMRCEGVSPAHPLVFIAILFTSGLDVGLIMFPLTEFGTYADITANPEYNFTNPLAIEFGFWGFLIWGFYFLTCFYFCVVEPKVHFFEIGIIKFLNNLVIIGTCAFTAYLLFSNLPWYLADVADKEAAQYIFGSIVLVVIGIAVFSSTDIKYVKILSVGSSLLFLALVLFLWLGSFYENNSLLDYLYTLGFISGYFTNIEKFMLPINDYHEFYLYWWFAWSIMIGQFTARFVGGMRTYQVMVAMVVVPSIPIALWFSVLYQYHQNEWPITDIMNWSMVFVGVTFVINSLDSLIRLYTDNLGLTVERLGRAKYWLGNFVILSVITIAFQSEFLEIQWIGALVILIYFLCFSYMLLSRNKLRNSL